MKHPIFKDEKEMLHPAAVIGHVSISDKEWAVLCADESESMFYLLVDYHEAFEVGTVLDTEELFPLEQADLPVKSAVRQFFEKGDLPDV